MGSLKNNEDYDFPIVEEAKISMALAEAAMNKSDIHFLSLRSEHEQPGLISQALGKWIAVSPEGHGGGFAVVTKDHPLLTPLAGIRRSSVFQLNDTLQAREFREILLIGKDLSIWDVSGRIVIQRNDQTLVSSAKRAITKMMSITRLLQQQNSVE